MVQTYYGTKRISATPMTLGAYNTYRGWELPDDEDPSTEGYLVEYPYDENTVPNHENHVGYISWSPAHVFEKSYQRSGDLSFGHAIEAAKNGHKIARRGWNGKNMWVALTPGSTFDARHAKPGHAAAHRAAELQNDLPHDGTENVIDLTAHLDMRAADGSMVIGWLASQSDMLADDWAIVE